MTSDEAAHYQIVRELFVRALELPEEEREAFLRAGCAGDEKLLAEVLSLLKSVGQPDGFLAQPFVDGSAVLGALKAEQRAEAPPPERIGGHRIVKLLGRGGMGVVYLAEQDNPRRLVAIKVLRADRARGGELLRFKNEIRALAGVQHPGIAQIFQAGVFVSEGFEQPWFSMEFVDGPPIVDFARANRLDTRAKLRLMARVCDAVEHAHERDVLHRDLKPSNILVDARGAPKVLDFGVARLAGSDGSTALTAAGEIVGTLSYMSPEQASGDPRLVDARMDVYALGAILYELLSDRAAFDLRDVAPVEALRRVREDDPTRLSQLAPTLRGDIDTIVAKALTKEREHRYATVREFAADLRRCLLNEPIHARPATALYHAARFMRRHRGLTVGAAVAFIALSGGLMATYSQLRRAHAAELSLADQLTLTTLVADHSLLSTLEREALELWPAIPARAVEIEHWIAKAEGLGERRELHAARLATLEAERQRDDIELVEQREHLARLDAFLTDRSEPLHITDDDLPTMRRRLDFARTLYDRSITDNWQQWVDAIKAVGDSTRCPLYHGLEIGPQSGLVPLGVDPQSGLWEFALFGPTGAIPTRDAETGKLDFDESSTLVFVLLPGGKALIGAQPENPARPHFDPIVDLTEGPVVEVSLAPFFISKFEMTKSQWHRWTGSDPSGLWVGFVDRAVTITGLHPIENVRREEALGALHHLSLTYPTEAQWEYAARAGTDSPWWIGTNYRELRGSENVRNGEFLARPGEELTEWPDDPFNSVHAPVGSFRPNPFGLYDIHGNVSEVCLDDFVPYTLGFLRAIGDGLVLAPEQKQRAYRGGDFAVAPWGTRLSARYGMSPLNASTMLGVRPVRLLDTGLCVPGR